MDIKLGFFNLYPGKHFNTVQQDSNVYLCSDDVAQIHPEEVEDFSDSCELTQRSDGEWLYHDSLSHSHSLT